MRLNDLERARPHWESLMQLGKEKLSVEMTFLRSSIRAFQAAWDHRENDLQDLQKEMKRLADTTDYAYLMIAAPLMCVHQLKYLNRYAEALRFAEDAEKQALYYNQDVWLPRIRIKIYELQKTIRRPPAIPKMYELLDLARAQHQNHIVHRCYHLLWEMDPQFERLQKDWKGHWQHWQQQIPEEYRESFRPAMEEI